MKVIFSFLENLNSRYSQSIKLSALSNFCAKKQGYETIFFGDENSLKKFGNINYDHKLKLDTTYVEKLPQCFWSSSKLISLLMMDEPCIHVDMDFLLTKPIENNFLKNDIICYHNEYFKGNKYKKLQNYFQIYPKNCESIDVHSYNCGIIGGNDIVSIKTGITILFDFISNHKNYIDDQHSRHPHEYLPTAVLIEQIWLFQIFKSLNKKINCLVDVKNFNNDYFEMWNKTGYIHFISNRKNQVDDFVSTLVKQHNIKY